MFSGASSNLARPGERGGLAVHHQREQRGAALRERGGGNLRPDVVRARFGGGRRRHGQCDHLLVERLQFGRELLAQGEQKLA